MLYIDTDKCSGCGSCVNICPKACITMKPDKAGFYYPQINYDECISCEACTSVCQQMSEQTEEVLNRRRQCYAAFCKDDKIRLSSSSGGVFYTLASYIVKNGGIVFGACYDKDFCVHHTSVCDLEQLRLLMGSKYVQSKIEFTYQEAKDYLENGKVVYFTGTPCEILGLQRFLGKKYEKLITQDIICHGVPSPLVWNRYLQYQSKNGRKSIKSITCRDKIHGWKHYSMKIEFDNATNYINRHGNDLMSTAFIQNMCLRPSCFHCKAKSHSGSDITLGDFWGIEDEIGDLNGDTGVSAVICNTIKGTNLLSTVKEDLIIKDMDYNRIVIHNPNAEKSPTKPHNYENFLRDIQNGDFRKVINRYCGNRLYAKVFKRCKKVIKKVTKNFLLL